MRKRFHVLYLYKSKLKLMNTKGQEGFDYNNNGRLSYVSFRDDLFFSLIIYSTKTSS
jgi:hypothetical protein